MGEPFYALNYYQKATALRPYDARMWSALAICYEKLKRCAFLPLSLFLCAEGRVLTLASLSLGHTSVPDAIKAYQRALVSSEPGENDTSLRIGRLYALVGNSLAAAQYHRRALYEGLKTEVPKNELSKIWIWLARWEMGREREVGKGSGSGRARGTKEGEGQGEGEGGDLRLAEEYLGEAMGVNEDKEVSRALEVDGGRAHVCEGCR